MAERIGAQHGFLALANRLKEALVALNVPGTQPGGAIDKVLDADPNTSLVGSLEQMRLVVNEHDDRLVAAEAELARLSEAVLRGPFG
jgi:hypothetical protein